MTTAFPAPSALPNPYTPLAWLSPTNASDFEASGHVKVATLAVFCWDWIMSWPDEYRVVLRPRLRISSLAYILSRLASFSFVLSSTLFEVSNVGSCSALQRGLGWCYAVALPATSALFYFRICAVFQYARSVVVGFGIIWLAILATSFTVPFAISADHVGMTARCWDTGAKPFATASVIANSLNDTLIFLAISWHLASFSTRSAGSTSERLRVMTRGDGLPRTAKVLLQGGQSFYLATVALNILTLIMMYAAHTPILKVLLTIPNVALENAMGTRVFRKIHLALATSPEHQTTGPGFSTQPPVFSLHRARSQLSRFLEDPVLAPETSTMHTMHTTTIELQGESDAGSPVKGSADDTYKHDV